MASLLESAFGRSDVDLYADVLKVDKACTLAQLRKGYYKQALKYHPDKNPGEDAKLKFQAISWAYQLLKDPEKRADYDNEGAIPHDDDFGNEEGNGTNAWKNYFDNIFGKLSKDDIDQFAMKYKMSEEEEKDVLKYYKQFKGNLVKMLGFVMLSEERDCARWVEDYIQPAMEAGTVEKYESTIDKTMKQIQKKIDKEAAGAGAEADTEKQVDSEATETEESEEESPKPSKQPKKQKKVPPKKAKSTTTKKKNSSQQDLIAAIRNKQGRGNPLASLGARYGVSMDDDDPLDDAAFAKIQSKLKKKKKRT